MRAVFLFAAFIIGGLLLLAACGGDEEVGQGLTFQTIESGQSSGIELEVPQLFNLETQEQWSDFWSRHASIMTPAPPLPVVDFDQEMIIAVVDQLRPSGGFTLEITEVLHLDDRLLVLATRRKPGPGCVTPAVITQPFHIVRLAKTHLQLQLAVSTVEFIC